MRFVSAVAVLFVFSLTPTHSNAKTEPPQDSDKSIALLQSALTAMGGASLQAIQDTRTRVNFQLSDAQDAPTYSATLLTRGLSDLRVDSQGPDGGSTTIITNLGASAKVGAESTEQISRNTYGRFPTSFMPVTILSGILNTPGFHVENVSASKESPSNLIELRISFSTDDSLSSQEPPTDVFLDPTTLMVIKMTYPQRASVNLNAFQIVEIDFDKYTNQNGILLPLVVTYSSDGHFITRQSVVSFEINVGAKGSDFDLGLVSQ